MTHRRVVPLFFAWLAAALSLAVLAGPASAAYDPGDPEQKAEYDATFALGVESYE